MSTVADASTIEIESFDDFMPMPGAETIVSPATNTPVKPGMFSRKGDVDMGFLDAADDASAPDDTSADTPDDAAVNALVGELDEADQDEEPAAKPAGRPKLDKTGLSETFQKLVDEGDIIPFDDDKPLTEYSVKDFQELLKANFEERERKVREQTPDDFFASLPEEMQAAAQYIAEGGRDMKQLFRALASVQEIRELDPSVPKDQAAITREYLTQTQFGTPDEIEEEITTWQDMNLLEKKALQFKPKLDKMRESMVEQQIENQKAQKLAAQQAQKNYVDTLYQTLKEGELGGVKLDRKIQQKLFTELSSSNYNARNGQKTNLLGHLMEKYHYVEPRMDLIAEATWLLSDPEGYRAEMRKQGHNDATVDVVRKLKTEEGRRAASADETAGTDSQKPGSAARRGIPRKPKNIFDRQ